MATRFAHPSNRSGFVLLILLTALTAPAFGQSVTATLVGTVFDPSGAVLPGATVIVTHRATNISQSVLTNDLGDFVVTNLRPGIYEVVAELVGFKRTIVDGVELLLDRTSRVDLTLQIGEMADVVQVVGTAPVVESETSSLGQVIDNRQMQSLPLKGRNFYELALLAPGTTPQMPGSFVGNRRPTPGGLNAPAFYVAGARETSNMYTVDGVDARDPHYLSPSIFPSVDSIQEFKLQTNAYSAEFGKSAAQITATTRSGTNELQVSLFHFLRNDLFDAAHFFDNFTGQGKAPLRYNQFGGTVGGPVRLPGLYRGQDRTFFFFNYEATRIRRGRTVQRNVPTVEQIQGNFSRLSFRNNRPIFDPATTRPNPDGPGFIRDPFPGNVIPAERITPFARAVLGLYPAPSVDVATGNNFFDSLSDVSDNDQFMVRIDHRISSRDLLFIRYSFFDGLQTNKSPIPFDGDLTDVRTQNMGLNYTRTFSPRTLYELRLGYNRPTYLILQEGAFQRDFAREVGMQNLLADSIGWGVPGISLSGFSGMGSEANPTTQISNVYQLINHLTLIRGSHNVKVGGELRRTEYNDRSERMVRGFFNFTGALTADPQSPTSTGVSLADLLLGLPLRARGSSTSLAGNFKGYSYAWFVQDDWKVHSRLTLNLGLRYEFDTRYTDVQNRLTFFDVDHPGGRLLLAGTSQAYIPGIGLTDGPPTLRGLIPADRNNWSPRIGLAFRPYGDARMAIRAGYGIFYDMIELQDLRTWVRNPPFGEIVDLTNDANANANAATTIRVADLFPAAGTPLSRPGAFGPTPKYPTPSYQQWNLSLQRALPRSLLAELAYVGSKGTHLIYRFNANQATLDVDPDSPTPILSRRPFPLFGNTIRLGDPGANSSYHGGTAKLERRFASGFSFLGSYTYSKSLDEASLIDNQPRDIRNRRLNKGRSQFDVRHRSVVSAIWDLPFGPGRPFLSQRNAVGHLLGGWQVNAIVSLRSGFPHSVGVSGDVCNCGAASQLADQVGDPGSGFTRSREQWFNTAAFAVPLRGTLGDSGRNILDGPGHATVDFSAFKNVTIREHAALQFRAEFFNFFNRTNFGMPGGTVGTPAYGIIQSAADPRIVQFGLKLTF